MDASEAVRTARHQAGISQRALAARVGMPQSTVGRIEAGLVSPRAQTLRAMLRAVGFDIFVLRRTDDVEVDRSLLDRFAALTPQQRIEYSASMGNLIIQLRSGLEA